MRFLPIYSKRCRFVVCSRVATCPTSSNEAVRRSRTRCSGMAGGRPSCLTRRQADVKGIKAAFREVGLRCDARRNVTPVILYLSATQLCLRHRYPNLYKGEL